MTELPVGESSPYSVYTGRTTIWPMVAATCLGAFLVAFNARQTTAPLSALAVPLVLIALGSLANVLSASSVRATVGPKGVTVHWGIIGWPRCAYRLDEIDRVEVVDLPWWRVTWGFWWTPTRTSCTVRSGPNMRLLLRNRRIVTITVPDPAAAVTALEAALGGSNRENYPG
jgi:hypothetical protein